eukprot:4762035-Lingulodinium_polyedra.AAC.1
MPQYLGRRRRPCRASAVAPLGSPSRSCPRARRCVRPGRKAARRFGPIGSEDGVQGLRVLLRPRRGR